MHLAKINWNKVLTQQSSNSSSCFTHQVSGTTSHHLISSTIIIYHHFLSTKLYGGTNATLSSKGKVETGRISIHSDELKMTNSLQKELTQNQCSPRLTLTSPNKPAYLSVLLSFLQLGSLNLLGKE